MLYSVLASTADSQSSYGAVTAVSFLGWFTSRLSCTGSLVSADDIQGKPNTHDYRAQSGVGGDPSRPNSSTGESVDSHGPAVQAHRCRDLLAPSRLALRAPAHGMLCHWKAGCLSGFGAESQQGLVDPGHPKKQELKDSTRDPSSHTAVPAGARCESTHHHCFLLVVDQG